MAHLSTFPPSPDQLPSREEKVENWKEEQGEERAEEQSEEVDRGERTPQFPAGESEGNESANRRSTNRQK